MKRIGFLLCFFLLIALFLFAFASIKEKRDSMTEFSSGIYFDKTWIYNNETPGTYHGIVVPDEQTALSIATAVFNGMEKSTEVQDFTAQAVFYDEEDRIWIVNFAKEDTHPYLKTLGNDCSIVIQASDGKILKIQFGE